MLANSMQFWALIITSFWWPACVSNRRHYYYYFFLITPIQGFTILELVSTVVVSYYSLLFKSEIPHFLWWCSTQGISSQLFCPRQNSVFLLKYFRKISFIPSYGIRCSNGLIDFSTIDLFPITLIKVMCYFSIFQFLLCIYFRHFTYR